MLDIKKLVSDIGKTPPKRATNYRPTDEKAKAETPIIVDENYETPSGLTLADMMSRLEDIPREPNTYQQVPVPFVPMSETQPNSVKLPTLTVPGGLSLPPTMAQTDDAEIEPPQKDPFQIRLENAKQGYNNALESKEHPSKWLSGLFLALQGIGKTFNPNDNTPIQMLSDARHNYKVGQAANVLNPLLKQRDDDQQTRLRDAQIADVLAKPGDRDAERLRKIDRDVVDAEYKDNLVGLGKQKADDIKTYREQIIELKRRGADQNDTRVQILEKRILETIRHNKATETQAAKNEVGRNTRAGNSIAATAGRQDAKSADEAAKVLAAIRLNAPQGTTEEQIVQKQQSYLQTLRKEIRSKIPQ